MSDQPGSGLDPRDEIQVFGLQRATEGSGDEQRLPGLGGGPENQVFAADAAGGGDRDDRRGGRRHAGCFAAGQDRAEGFQTIADPAIKLLHPGHLGFRRQSHGHQEPLGPPAHRREVGNHPRGSLPPDRPGWGVGQEMHPADQGVGFQELQGVAARAGIDHRTIVTGSRGGLGIPRDQPDEPRDQGVFTDLAERGHGKPSSGRWQ